MAGWLAGAGRPAGRKPPPLPPPPPPPAGAAPLHSWCSRCKKNSGVIVHVYRTQADSNYHGATKPQPLPVGMLAFHGLFIGEPTKTMLTNELNGLCRRDIFLWEGAMRRKIRNHETGI